MSAENTNEMIMLKLVNAETGNQMIKPFNENTIMKDIYCILYEEGFLSPAPEHFSWFCDRIDDFTVTIKSYSLYSGDILTFQLRKMISCIIINGHTGADCDIDVPVEATLGDVIVGLINVGFLDEDATVAPIVLYNKVMTWCIKTVI